MAEYSFLTTWILEADRERVWEAIEDSERWPEWWRGVKDVVELDPGEPESGIGQRARMTWRSRLPYDLVFEVTTTRKERPSLLEARATGELAGVGRWRLYEEGGTTAVAYEWNVSTTKAWMNLLAPVARPAFAVNHNWVMRNGGEGLARRLDAPLLAAD